MKISKNFPKIFSRSLLPATSYVLLATQRVAAQNPLGNADDLNLPDVQADSGVVEQIIDILFYLAGALSIIFIIAGGLMYIFSAGNPETAKKAKSTIVFALIGLATTVSAWLIARVIIGLVTGENIKTL